MRGRTRQPTPPGELLHQEFLAPLQVTQKQLAEHLGCDVKVINRIVNGHTRISAQMALKLGASLGTSPEFWLNAQKAVDLFHARKTLKALPRRTHQPARIQTAG